MVSHGEWTTDDPRISKCEALEFLDKNLSERKRWPKSRLPLHAECPLCQFLKDVLDAPKDSDVAIRPMGKYRPALRRDVKVKDDKVLRGIIVVMLADGSKHRRRESKFLLQVPSRDRTGNDKPPTSWKQFYTHHEPGQIFPYRCPLRDAADMDLAKTWLTGCQTKHVARCSEVGPDTMSHIASLPDFQLIDCIANTIVHALRVSEYVALSYVWGDAYIKNGEGASLDAQPDGILPPDLPRTVQDAMAVVLKLGYQYLWVDKYCINQASDHHAFQAQLAAMGAIYTGAVFTIIAAAGMDANYGLPGIGNRQRIEHPSIKIDGITWVAGSANPDLPYIRSKWATRGWTYQEAYFSRRRLIFTDEQVLFECNTCNRNESMVLGMDDEKYFCIDICGLESGYLQSEMPLSHHISEYTCRTLSYSSDILNAMQGLFSAFSKADKPSKEFWGIPINDVGYVRAKNTSRFCIHAMLAHGLTWDYHYIKGSVWSSKRRAGFPSWSWAGWTTPVRFRLLDYSKTLSLYQPHFQLLELDGTSTELTEDLIDELLVRDNDKMPLYTSPPLLSIEADIIQVQFLNKGTTQAWAVLHTVAVDQPSIEWIFSPTASVADCSGMAEALSTQRFDCIILTRDRGLVVWEINGTTERIGILLGHEVFSSLELIYLGDFLPSERRSIVLG